MKAVKCGYVKKYFKTGYYDNFVQPALSSDGVLGGSDFAVDATTNGGVPDFGRGTAYGACYPQNGSYNSYTKGGAPTVWFTLYTPDPIILKSFEYSANWDGGGFHVTLDGSNDNATWTNLSPTTMRPGGAQIVSLDNNNPFMYYRITIQCPGGAHNDGVRLSGIQLIGKKYGGYIEVGENEDYDFTKDVPVLKLPKIQNKYYAVQR